MRPAEPLLDLFSEPEFYSGSKPDLIRHCTGWLEDSEFEITVVGEDRFRLSARMQEDWVSEVKPGRIIRLVLGGNAWEWVIGGRQDTRASQGTDRVVIDLLPLHVILANVGPFEDTLSGGVSHLNSGAVPLTPEQYVKTFFIPHMERHGAPTGKIAAGTMDSTKRVELSWNNLTLWQIAGRIAEETGTERRFYRNESNRTYDMGFFTQIGSAAEDAWAHEALNVIRVRRERTLQQLRSVIRPIGSLIPGSSRQADIGEHVLVVTAKPSTDEITVEFPDIGGHPIAEDDQWCEVQDEDSNVVAASHYLELADGTFEEITDAVASTGTFTVDDGSGISVGDYVRIVRDSSGTLITEIPSPSAIAEYGRIVGPRDFNGRGERNWAPNGMWYDQAADRERVWTGACDGNQSGGTSLDLKNISSVSTTIPAGSILVVNGYHTRRVSSSAAVDGSGNATVTVDSTIPVVSDDDELHLFVFPGFEPDGWQMAASAGNPDVAMMTRAVGGSVATTGSLVGAIAFDDIRITVDGLTNGDIVPAGTRVEFDTSSYGNGSQPARVVLQDATVSGGSVELVVTQRIGETPADNTGVTFVQPTSKPVVGGLYEVGFPLVPSTGEGWESDQFTIRHMEGWDQLVVTAHFYVINESAPNTALTITSTITPRLKIIRQDGGPTVVANIALVDTSPTDDVEVPGQGEYRGTLQATYTIPEGESPDLTVRLEPIRDTAGSGGSIMYQQIWLQAVTAYLTTDAAAPPTNSSFANRLMANGQTVLTDLKEWGASYEVSVFDLARAMDVSPQSISYELGGFVWLSLPSLRDAQALRVAAIRVKLSDPENPTLILERRPDLLTSRARSPKRPRQFALVEVGGEQFTVSPEDEPPVVAGVRRAGAAGVVEDSDGAVAIGEVE